MRVLEQSPVKNAKTVILRNVHKLVTYANILTCFLVKKEPCLTYKEPAVGLMKWLRSNGLKWCSYVE